MSAEDLGGVNQGSPAASRLENGPLHKNKHIYL